MIVLTKNGKEDDNVEESTMHADYWCGSDDDIIGAGPMMIM